MKKQPKTKKSHSARRTTTTTSVDPIEAVLAKLDVIKKTKGGGMALCPAHDDTNPSLSVQVEKKGLLLYCHAGCSLDAICAALGVKPKDLVRNQQQVVATYPYRDDSGTLVYEVLRYEPGKTFKQRRPDGTGKWVWNLNGVPRLLYGSPELQGADEAVITEGEKDADRLAALGVVATCNSGGAGKWTDEHTEQLKEAGVTSVVILPDNDPPGEEHGNAVAHSCMKAGLSVKLVALPELPPKGDVCDFFDKGHTIEDLRALVDATPEWVESRPPFDCSSDDLTPQTEALWTLIAERQRRNPTLFRRGTEPVRAEIDEHGRVRLVLLTEARCRLETGRLVTFTKTVREKDRVIKAPNDLMTSLLSTPSSDTQLPLLQGIIETPVVSRAGKMIHTPGYDPVSQLLLRPYDPTADLTFPTNPTSKDLKNSRSLLDEMLIDFPFVSEADRTHAVGLMCLPFLRPYIDGPTPLLLVEASAPGSGKGLLVNAVLYPAVGSNVGVISEPRDESELRKLITARVLEGAPVTVIDNVTREVNSSVLSAAVTSVLWEDRMLGKTETLRMPVTTIWVMTANNPVLHTDIARRTVRVRLDPKVERPWLREGFRHPNLLAWVKERRAHLIRAILSIIQAWLQEGQPASNVKPLGSFESWTRVVGGLVTFAGYDHFLGNAMELYSESDAEGEIWRAFTAEWWTIHKDEKVTVKNLIMIAERIEIMDLGRSDNERSKRTSLGMQLKRKRDAIVGPYRIEMVGVSNNAAEWRLHLIDVSAVITIRKSSKAHPTHAKAKY